MPINSTIRGILLAATASIFAGCSSPAALTPAGPQAPYQVRTTAHLGFTSPEVKAGKKLIYIADSTNGVVNVYSQKGSNQSPIGQLTNLGGAGALAVAKNRDLYVAGGTFSQPAIYVFHQGQQTPYTTLSGGGFGLALDSKGNLYATQFGNVINVYAAGSTIPTSTLSDTLCLTNAVAADRKGNIFVDGFDCQPPPNDGQEVDMFPAGSSTPMKLISNIQSAGGLAVDHKGNLVVQDTGAGTVSVYAPPYNGLATSTFSFSGAGVGIALDKTEKNVWVSANNVVSGLPNGRKFSLKTGMLLDSTSTTDLLNAQGIALSPPGKI
jgi:hypothetical protein